jgi:hypothetical protein
MSARPNAATKPEPSYLPAPPAPPSPAPPAPTARIMIHCPATNDPIPTGLEAEIEGWEGRSLSYNRVFCPACKETHYWNKGQAWLENRPAP